MRHLLVCLPLPTAAQTKSEHFPFAERQALRFGTDAMSRTTLILVTFVLATGYGDSGNPVGPSPTSIPKGLSRSVLIFSERRLWVLS